MVEHLAEFVDVLAEGGDLFFEGGEAGLGFGVGPGGGSRREGGVPVERGFAGEEVGPARFFRTGEKRQLHGEGIGVTFGEALKGAGDDIEVFEGVEASRVLAQFAASLRAAQEEGSEDGEFAAREVPLLGDAVAVFFDPAAGFVDEGGEAAVAQGVERGEGGGVVVGDHRVAVALLVARVHEGVERKRIVFGRGKVFLDQRAQDAAFFGGEIVGHITASQSGGVRASGGDG